MCDDKNTNPIQLLVKSLYNSIQVWWQITRYLKRNGGYTFAHSHIQEFRILPCITSMLFTGWHSNGIQGHKNRDLKNRDLNIFFHCTCQMIGWLDKCMNVQVYRCF